MKSFLPSSADKLFLKVNLTLGKELFNLLFLLVAQGIVKSSKRSQSLQIP
ncbi:MAG: hypothetical protein IEMM0008_1815 [bacterium]|nr:MAG: hypothetical protein IEMM0008_1815 [bacterium]